MDLRRIESLWAHVHWLTVLGDLGSYTAAARRLGVSKAAMSQRISELEHAAGVPLVRRTTRSVRLTDAGVQLAEASRGAFAQIERGFESVRNLADAPRGLIRVTAPVALGRQHVVPLLPAFLRAHPQVRVELQLSDHLASMAQEGFDLAIRHCERPPETHVAWPLTRTESWLLASPDYLAQAGTPTRPSELAAHPCLHYPRPGEPAVWRFRPPTGDPAGAPLVDTADGHDAAEVAVAVSGPLSANNSEALRDAALAGLGIALLPDFTAQAALRAGQLVRVLAEWQALGAFGEHLWAIRPYSALVPSSVQALVTHLRAGLAGGFGA
ncbi:LysR family transcriptional regulator [Sphaerotilus microaerophilus]|uniref:LysR family transcriptional regulator n=1 Tax=Sphaerotilus microaerophilus TaxID=2914710 RepID=A0ABN6PHM4_9BURK|nr:LysR family transcriptional regulator [Sphaerotilus sp. FB-5]BDI03499.1 LysR family transcriptional regulator [Sphaerotilus sp. FB-5]